MPCTAVPPRFIMYRDGQDRLAGRVPARPLLSEMSKSISLGQAPGRTQAGGKAGPVNKFLPSWRVWTCTQVRIAE